MPRKPSTAQVDTYSDIQNAAFGLFGQLGYDGVSIDAIAKAANLSKGALYWHFDGKEALFLDCLKRLHGLHDELIFDPMLKETDAVIRIQVFFSGLAALLEHPSVSAGVAGYWLGTANTTLPEIDSARKAFEKRTANIIQETLRLGIQQGALDMGGDISDMSRAIIAIMEAIILPLRNESSEEIQRVLSVLARTLVRAYAMDENLVSRFKAI